MHRPILALLSLLTVLGCGADPLQQAAQQTPDDRLAVNDRLRTACPYMTDLNIEAALIAYEQDRLSGLPKADAIAAVIDACSQLVGVPDAAATWSECQTCGIVVIDQVYGP